MVVADTEEPEDSVKEGAVRVTVPVPEEMEALLFKVYADAVMEIFPVGAETLVPLLTVTAALLAVRAIVEDEELKLFSRIWEALSVTVSAPPTLAASVDALVLFMVAVPVLVVSVRLLVLIDVPV